MSIQERYTLCVSHLRHRWSKPGVEHQFVAETLAWVGVMLRLRCAKRSAKDLSKFEEVKTRRSRCARHECWPPTTACGVSLVHVSDCCATGRLSRSHSTAHIYCPRTVRPWSRTQPFADRQNPLQCHLLDYTIHSPELRSVDFTAAASDNSLLTEVRVLSQ